MAKPAADKQDPNNRRGYHHGNLKQALMDAAIELIPLRGPEGFTFAEIARTAGVSAAAPYRHFKSKDDLLAEIAREGFEDFSALLRMAWNNGQPTPISAFEKMGRAYLAFAERKQGVYMSMFESGLRQADYPALALAAEDAMQALDECCHGVLQLAHPEDRPPVRLASLHVWALAHGVAELFGRNAAGKSVQMSPEDMLESGMLVYLRGLGIITR